MKTKRAVILLNGELSDVRGITRYIDADTVLIAADGGMARFRQLGLKPNVVIGDFDSITALPRQVRAMAPGQTIIYNDIEYIRYSTDKHYTDSELAVRYALQSGSGDIILGGLLGNRLDHLLANILLLQNNDFQAANIRIIEGTQEIYLIRERATITGKVGDIISFMPIAGSAQIRRSSGLKYDLSKYLLSVQGNLGVSNVLVGRTAEISLTQGVLLVIHERPASR
jgi:thiamine pyrophosphokinase